MTKSRDIALLSRRIAEREGRCGVRPGADDPSLKPLERLAAISARLERLRAETGGVWLDDPAFRGLEELWHGEG